MERSVGPAVRGASHSFSEWKQAKMAASKICVIFAVVFQLEENGLGSADHRPVFAGAYPGQALAQRTPGIIVWWCMQFVEQFPQSPEYFERGEGADNLRGAGDAAGKK